jgi:hypothetical protein
MVSGVLSDLFRLGALTLCVLLIVGCTEVVKSTPNEIHIDTGELGQLVPGSRHWLALISAKKHCDDLSKNATLEGLKEEIVVYRCTDRE